MRCPKCHYISFESTDRCRNCGYDFGLAAAAEAPATELPLNDRNEEPRAPVDLSLARIEELSAPLEGSGPVAHESDGSPAADSGTPVDLPLFKPKGAAAPIPHVAQRRPVRADPDAPLVSATSAPRAPVAVRRATPDAQRIRARYSRSEVPQLDLDVPPLAFSPIPEVEPAAAAAPDESGVPAPAVRRLVAAAIDTLIVIGIDIAVLYFTLKLCGLPLSSVGLLALPPVPLIGFLLLIDGGYIVTFTAVIGQTIGKMAMGIRVVPMNEAADAARLAPNFGFAILRTAAYAASFLPVGLGFLPALVARDRRALHDRLAETRVVRI